MCFQPQVSWRIAKGESASQVRRGSILCRVLKRARLSNHVVIFCVSVVNREFSPNCQQITPLSPDTDYDSEMDTLQVLDLRARRRVLAVFDTVFPEADDPVDLESLGVGTPFSWREPLFQVFRETYDVGVLGSDEFLELIGEWIAVRSEMTEDVRVELFAMSLAWSEWLFAWSRRF